MAEEKRGRGRPPKNPDEEGLDLDNTRIEGNDVPRETRGRPKGTNIQKETIADKLNMIADAVFSLFGYEYNFKPEDYKKEALALSNLAKDYKAIAAALQYFDPLLIVCGVWQKFKTLKKKPKEEKKQSTPPPVEQPQQNNGGNNILQFKGG